MRKSPFMALSKLDLLKVYMAENRKFLTICNNSLISNI
jgi:hypothetical protein